MADEDDRLDEGREALRRFLVGDDDRDTMLATVIDLAVDAVPGADLGSITLLSGTEVTTPVCTEEAARQLDARQYADDEGPCLAAMRHQGVEILHVRDDERWPGFRATARELGVVTSLAVPLLQDEMSVGGLNLHARAATDFDERAVEVACGFADQIGLAAASASRLAEGWALAEQLRRAMESRAVIEQAKGILMAAERCGPDGAFDILRRASQARNRKLRDVAAEIVERYSTEG